jgi:serine phosphatase RsbU (regulator of sigma subunit)
MIPGLDIAVRYRAASGEGQVGGDFFDVFPLPDGEWVVLIGDVSGRGPRAAALTALARYTLRAAAVGATSPSAVLKVLNDVVRRELEAAYEGDERFLTAAFLTISPSAEGFSVAVACGGHPHPLRRRSSGVVEEIPCEGELIGAFDAHESRDELLELAPGDVVVLVTDGVIEARREQDEFGEGRLRAVVSEGATTAREFADAIDAAVVAHVGGPVQDDVAIVVLRLPDRMEAGDTSLDVRVSDAARSS